MVGAKVYYSSADNVMSLRALMKHYYANKPIGADVS